jgi:hypothetical protein
MNQDDIQSSASMNALPSDSVGGYTCFRCGQWAAWDFPHYCHDPYQSPMQTIYTNILPSEITEKLDQILKELQEIKELLK